MKIFKDINSLKEWQKTQSGKIGFIPTMGALHKGHLSLIKKCLQKCDTTIVSIFINPLQFNNNLDLKNYPNPIDEDINLLQSENIDALFLPSKGIMYSGTFSTIIEVSKISIGLEGDSRPGHFNGVATVVTRLFSIIEPNMTTFGEKDAQQLRIVQYLNTSLKLGIDIIPIPTVREPDGLAISSRNVRLSPGEREAARVLHRSLLAAQKSWGAGERNGFVLRESMASVLAREPLAVTDYASIADANTFQEVDVATEPARALVAVNIGNTRLIDNMLLGQLLNPGSRGLDHDFKPH